MTPPPLPNFKHVTEDTPARPRSTHDHSAINGTLDERRDAALRNLGYVVPEIPAESFMSSFLPPLKEGIDVNKVLSSLRHDGEITSENVWKHYVKEPKEYDSSKARKGERKHEDKVFEPLEEIFDQAVLRARNLAPHAGLDQTLVMRLLPRSGPVSSRESTSKPDAIGILKEAEDRTKVASNDRRRWWYDIALSGEFKKTDNLDNRDDVSWLIGSLNTLIFPDLLFRMSARLYTTCSTS